MRVAAMCAWLLVAAPARADDAPAELTATAAEPAPPLAIPPWILTSGNVRLDATAELDVSSNKVAKPFALAPDLWFGVTDDLTLGVTESKFAQTGFRGSAGNAFCITGTSAGCPSVYNNVGLEAWSAVVRGPLAIAVGGGPYAVNLDRSFYDVKLGVKARLRSGHFSFLALPSVFVAATGRDVAKPANHDMLYLPIAAAAHLTEHAMLGLASGIKGPLEDFSSNWAIPIGVNASYGFGPITIGASFAYGALWSGLPAPAPGAPAVDGMDLRVLQMWVSYTTAGASPRRTPEPAAKVAASAPPPRIHAAATARPAVGKRSASPTHPAEHVHEREPEPKFEPEPSFVRASEGERIPAETVTALAHQHAAELAGCVVSPELDGDVTITFEVNAKGHIAKTEIRSTIHDIATSDCLLGVVRGFEVAPPPHGNATGVYTVSYRSH